MEPEQLTNEDVFGFFKGERVAWIDPDTKKAVFELRRKEPADGSIYYIIRLTEANITDPTRKAFLNSVFPFIKKCGRMLKIPLIDFDEISERVMEATKKRFEEKGEPIDPEFTATIEVMDLATGELMDLDMTINPYKTK